MAVASFFYLLILIFFKYVTNYSIHVKSPEINVKEFNATSHLQYEVVLKVCADRDKVCESNNERVCAMRIWNNTNQYKDFKNMCYVFLNNMCDNPGEEFYIKQTGTCEEYLSSRRNDEVSTEEGVATEMNSTIVDKDILRDKSKTTKFSTLYDIETAYDYHPCPHSCPNVYSPVCVNVNRGFGRYFKMLNFVNHCESDLYYCKNWREFAPPPYEDENVQDSQLSWSFCGSIRYLQFARFAEVASSLGHYGWLAGNYRYTHIMEPHQRIPGYG